ncbi:MAG: hypothetical protein ACOYO1_18330 [Bacteroidales bacterium]
MKNLELFLENPFKSIVAGKEKTLEFYDFHNNSMIQQVNMGAPFAALLGNNATAFDALCDSLGDTATKVAEQKSKTYTTDECIELFVAKAKEFEAGIRDKFNKDSAIYLEFYPQGMKPFNNISKKSIKEVMTQYIAAYNIYKADLGISRYDEVVQIQEKYLISRKLQEQKKSETKNIRSSWDDCLLKMQDQAYTNLLSIALYHKGNPEKIKLYFNQSIVNNHKHNSKEDIGGYILSLPVNGGVIANISYSANDKFMVSNHSNDAVYYSGIVSAGSTPADAELIRIEAGAEVEVTALSLGAPTKKFWYFANKNTTSAGEVEIIQL